MENKNSFKPVLEVIEFNNDIITTSGGGQGVWDDNE